MRRSDAAVRGARAELVNTLREASRQGLTQAQIAQLIGRSQPEVSRLLRFHGLALVVVGSLLVSDLERSPAHTIVAVVGGIVGYAFGAYRARTTYVAAVPAHKGVILRYSLESFAALGLLIVIKLVAEQNLLPDGDIFRIIIASKVAGTFADFIESIDSVPRDAISAVDSQRDKYAMKLLKHVSRAKTTSFGTKPVY